MNILLVTNNLYATGGDWTYVKQVFDLYKTHGHKVFLFGLRMEQNLDKTYQDFYVPTIDLSYAKKHPFKSGLKVLSTTLYSKSAARNIARFIKDFSIDIVQINSIHLGVTASIIRVINRLNIPIVYRIIDYSQVCPNIHMIRDGKICKECLGNRFYKCFIHNCKKSRLTSLFVALNGYFYTLRGDYNLIDMYSFQNDFMRRLFIQYGYKEDRAVTICNPYDSTKVSPSFRLGNSVLFIARLEPEKGIRTFLKAAKLNPEISHIVVGKGSIEDEVKSIIEELDNVEFKGSVWGTSLDNIIKECRFVVCPSEWEEPSSYVAFQSFSCGKPVIASQRGGLPEVVEDNINGMLFKPGDVEDLASKIKLLYNDEAKLKQFSTNARLTVESKFSPETYYNTTIELFTKLIENKNKKRL